MTTDLSFITNEKNQSLKDRFEVLIKDTSFLTALQDISTLADFMPCISLWRKQKR